MSAKKPAGKAPCPSRPDVATGDCRPRGDGDGFRVACRIELSDWRAAQATAGAARAPGSDGSSAGRDESAGG